MLTNVCILFATFLHHCLGKKNSSHTAWYYVKTSDNATSNVCCYRKSSMKSTLTTPKLYLLRWGMSFEVSSAFCEGLSNSGISEKVAYLWIPARTGREETPRGRLQSRAGWGWGKGGVVRCNNWAMQDQKPPSFDYRCSIRQEKKKSIHQKVTCKLNIETWTGVLQYEQGCWQADLGFKLLTLQPHSVTESTTQPTWQVRVERTRKCMRVKCWITRLPHYRKDYWLRVCWCEWCGPIQCSGGPDHTLILKLGAAVWNLKHEEIKE